MTILDRLRCSRRPGSHWHAGLADATTTVDGRYLPNPPPAFGGEINLSAKELEALLAAADRAAQGRTERPADHDR